MVKKKKIIFAVSLIFLILLLLVGLYIYFFSSMSRLPQGEYLYSDYNPSKEYKINVFLCRNSLSSDAIRCERETLNTGEKENIYWCYKRSRADIKWLDDYEVVINDEKINILTEKYDWRKDRYFKEDYEQLDEIINPDSTDTFTEGVNAKLSKIK